jgi:glycine betaine transporter
MKRYLKLFHPGHYVFALLILLGATIPDRMAEAFADFTSWFSLSFGWLVLLICAVFVGLAAYIACSRYGDIRLGGPDEKPQFSTLSWIAMLFAAGMGSGLIFYGAAEPLTHYMNHPPAAKPVLEGAGEARRAMTLTFFHWGIHAWAIYAIAAISIAFFTFHKNKPMVPGAPMQDSLSPKWRAPVVRLVNLTGIIGVVFGLVSSLSVATLQISEGLDRLLHPEMDVMHIRLGILALMFICYTASASTGLGKGIKILSDVNMGVAVLLLLFIIATGPTLFIMETFVSGIGDYLDSFIALSFNTRQYSDTSGWTAGWSISYFMWWISWGPFVGVFIARISRGRSLREFLCGVILIPTLFCALWFSALGGTALHLELVSAPGFAASIPNIQSTTYEMISHLPLQEITSVIVLLLMFVFLITSADSGSYVLAMFTTDGNISPPVMQRIAWGVLVGLVTAGALLSGRGPDFFRAFAVVGSVPYMGVMCWQVWCFWKAMRAEKLS